MADNNNLVVYCEFDEGRIADVSLELLTKGRKLADRLGIRLTENGAMYPQSSVCGLLFSHPQSRYFALG